MTTPICPHCGSRNSIMALEGAEPGCLICGWRPTQIEQPQPRPEERKVNRRRRRPNHAGRRL